MVENAKVEDFLKTIIDDVRYRLQQEEDKQNYKEKSALLYLEGGDPRC